MMRRFVFNVLVIALLLGLALTGESDILEAKEGDKQHASKSSKIGSNTDDDDDIAAALRVGFWNPISRGIEGNDFAIITDSLLQRADAVNTRKTATPSDDSTDTFRSAWDGYAQHSRKILSETRETDESKPRVIKSDKAVVAADDYRCSKVGVSILEKGGHAVDAAIAVALCLGVVCPTSSGIGGGGFMVVRNSLLQSADAFIMRETAPSAASKDMYANDSSAKSEGPMSMGVPGEIAGFHAAWQKYGRLSWRDLFEPAIKFAKKGFVISHYTAYYMTLLAKDKILKDPGLREVFTRNGELLKAGDVCKNEKLGNTLQAIAEQGLEAFYDGPIGEKLVDDVKRAGGILTMDDLRNYRVKVTEPVSFNAFGYEILGAPPPSTGALGIALVLNILDGYEDKDALRGPVGLHRLVEAMKHMNPIRMDLGDPDFEDIEETVSKMLSSSFAASIRKKIHDNTTFSDDYYKPRWSQLEDHGTSHTCIVDSDRNVVSMTISLNELFGGGMLSTSTGIIINNHMNDFSTPTDETKNKLPPAEPNYIKPTKRPISSASPIIILKENQFFGAIGGGGGSNIIPAVILNFINLFVLEMDPLEASRRPRIYYNSSGLGIVSYENWTVYSGELFAFPEEQKQCLIERGHKLNAMNGGAMCHFVVHNLAGSEEYDRQLKEDDVFRGSLTAVCDPRKGGFPAALISQTFSERLWNVLSRDHVSTSLRGMSTFVLHSPEHGMKSEYVK